MSTNKIVIRVSHLGKKYQLGGPQEPYHTFRDAIVNSLKAPMKVFHKAPLVEGFWALKDVSFEVEQGEVVGIIGRNGAGKSTLLKILSRITTPTEGTVELYGRVGSLLEVGDRVSSGVKRTGEHILSGSILGMKRREIDAKLDAIVKFSEIEKFLDTPVKRYSSGMYVRLAFAVAAHMDTEILLVDEVLAVGDASFQKKCMGKMGDVAKEGRTVLFVSHNMGAITSLCSRGLLISNGQISKDGDARVVTSEYQSMLYSHIDTSSDLTNIERYGNGKGRFVSVKIIPRDSEQQPQEFLHVGQDLEITLKILAHQDIFDANVAMIIYEQSGYRLIDANTAMKNSFLSLKQGQIATVTFILQNVLVRPGNYLLGLWLGRANIEDIDGILYAKQFSVEIDPYLSESAHNFPGIYLCNYNHSIKIN